MPSGSPSSRYSARPRSRTCSCRARSCCVWPLPASGSACRRQSTRSCALRLRDRLVLKNDDAGAECLRMSQLEGLLFGALCEQPPARAQDERVHHQPITVDDVLVLEHIEEVGTSREQEIPAGFLLE